jgi:pimeloyl-ACP methyl ester carboxylesterase
MIASAPSAEQRHADDPGHSAESPSVSGRIRRRTVHANGLDFPILEAGHGPLVLCLHGFPDHAQSWIPFLGRLAQEGYWAVAPALRGYWVDGAAPDGSYRASATGQDVLALIESLGAEQAVLVGHDLGARAAYAAASLDAGRIRKLVGLAVPYGKGLASAFVADGDQQRRSWYMFFFQTRLAEMAAQLNDFALFDRLWRNGHRGTCCRLRIVLHSTRPLPSPASSRRLWPIIGSCSARHPTQRPKRLRLSQVVQLWSRRSICTGRRTAAYLRGLAKAWRRCSRVDSNVSSCLERDIFCILNNPKPSSTTSSAS